VENALIAANVGIMVFFTIAVAPTVFKILPPAWAGAYVRAFFPKYYAFLGLTSALAAALADNVVDRVALSSCAVLFFVSLFMLTPRINAARDAGDKGTFGTLHGLSVGINFVQLAIFAGLLSRGL
jgi:hypothetical protein